MLRSVMQNLYDVCACAEARGWVRQFDTPQQAWNACKQPEWMLWVLGRSKAVQKNPTYQKRFLSLMIEIVLRYRIYEVQRAQPMFYAFCIGALQRKANGENVDELIDLLRKEIVEVGEFSYNLYQINILFGMISAPQRCWSILGSYDYSDIKKKEACELIRAYFPNVLTGLKRDF